MSLDVFSTGSSLQPLQLRRRPMLAKTNRKYALESQNPRFGHLSRGLCRLQKGINIVRQNRWYNCKVCLYTKSRLVLGEQITNEFRLIQALVGGAMPRIQMLGIQPLDDHTTPRDATLPSPPPPPPPPPRVLGSLIPLLHCQSLLSAWILWKTRAY